MLLQKRTVSVLSITLVALCSLFLQNTAFAKNYTRSCGVQYSVIPTSVRGGGSWQFNFTGKGTIGYFNPNEARERARRNIDECIDEHWRRYTATGRPSQCTESNKVYSYPVGSLVSEMSRNICRLNPGHSSVTVTVVATYNGDKGCTLKNNSWRREIARNHTVNCPGAEIERNIDRPGGDFRNFSLRSARPDLCRVACVNDSRCRAWTYVQPGVQGDQARCWLKNSVPPARRNNNCVSGVKTVM